MLGSLAISESELYLFYALSTLIFTAVAVLIVVLVLRKSKS